MTTPYSQDQQPAVVPDLLSFDSWENETTAMSSTTLSTSPSSASMDDSIHVSISGVIFSLDPATFDKLRKLPWQTEEARPSSDDEDDDIPVASYSLSTSPELFDILLHHVLFGTLPPSMAAHDMEELEIMALSLDLQSLVQHLQVSQPPPRRRLTKAHSCPNHKVSAVRSWAAVKRWSSTGKLVKKTKKAKKSKHQPQQDKSHQATHMSSSTTRHLA